MRKAASEARRLTSYSVKGATVPSCGGRAPPVTLLWATENRTLRPSAGTFVAPVVVFVGLSREEHLDVDLAVHAKE